MVDHARIGQLLIEKGLITEKQMESALAERGDSYARFGEVLVAKGWITEDDVLDCLAQQYGIPVADTKRVHCEPEALRLFRKQFALTRLVLPVRIKADRLQCVVADPLDFALNDALQAAHGCELDMMLASPSEIKEAIERVYVEQPV